MVKNLAEQLCNMGHTVRIIAGEPSAGKVSSTDGNGVEITRIPTFAPNGAYHLPRNSRTYMRTILNATVDADILHVHNVHSVISIMATKFKEARPHVRLVITPHYHGGGHTLVRNFLWRLYWGNKAKEALIRAEKIHTITEAEAKKVVESCTHVKGKIVTIPNGIQQDVFRYVWKGERSDYILYAGRLEKYKRLDLVIRALSELKNRGNTALKLRIIGEGPDGKRLQRIAKQYFGSKWAKEVVFEYPKVREEYLEALACARVAISVSRWEAFNVFLAEAYSIGVPVVATQEAVPFCPKLANTLPTPISVARGISDVLDISSFRYKQRREILTWSKVANRIVHEVYSYSRR